MTYAQAEVIGRCINSYTFGLITTTAVTKEVAFDASTKAVTAGLFKAAADNDINPYDAVVALTPEYFAKVLSLLDSNVYGGTDAIREGRIPGLYGFKSFICTTYLPEGTRGAIIARNSIGLASKYLEPMAGAYPDAWKSTDGNGMTIGYRSYQDLATGKRFLACEALFGAKLLQADKIVRLEASVSA